MACSAEAWPRLCSKPNTKIEVVYIYNGSTDKKNKRPVWFISIFMNTSARGAVPLAASQALSPPPSSSRVYMCCHALVSHAHMSLRSAMTVSNPGGTGMVSCSGSNASFRRAPPLTAGHGPQGSAGLTRQRCGARGQRCPLCGILLGTGMHWHRGDLRSPTALRAYTSATAGASRDTINGLVTSAQAPRARHEERGQKGPPKCTRAPAERAVSRRRLS